jgi:DNA-binding NtrC family response regulator
MHGQRKVLIIDDEIDLCLLLKSYFLRKDYDVQLSHGLEEGLELIRYQQPDILFLDNNLPDGIGWNMAPQLAAEFPDLHIVLISAFHPEMPKMPTNAHVQMIEKPISLIDLDKQFAEITLQQVIK